MRRKQEPWEREATASDSLPWRIDAERRLDPALEPASAAAAAAAEAVAVATLAAAVAFAAAAVVVKRLR